MKEHLAGINGNLLNPHYPLSQMDNCLFSRKTFWSINILWLLGLKMDLMLPLSVYLVVEKVYLSMRLNNNIYRSKEIFHKLTLLPE